MIDFFRRIIKRCLKCSHKKVQKTDKKWFQHELSHEELKRYIEVVRKGKRENALIGKIANQTMIKIKSLIGTDITKIIFESSAIIHAEKDAKHHLKEDDLLKRIEVINNPQNVKVSPRKNRGCPVLLFEGDNNGTIIFVERVHIKHGELSLITAYRKNEAGQGSTGSKNPGTYVQNGLPPTSISIITHPKIVSSVLFLLNLCGFVVIGIKEARR